MERAYLCIFLVVHNRQVDRARKMVLGVFPLASSVDYECVAPLSAPVSNVENCDP